MARFIVATAFLVLVSCSSAHNDRPNVILFIADDISWDDFGCYGNTSVQTPNIDALAATGLLFTNAYLTTSSCSPSRCSVITGRYPHNTGAPELHMPLPKTQVVFPALLQEAGYHTIQAGKFHLGEAVRSAFDDCRELKNGGPGGENQWVPALADRPADQPFFAWLAAVDAHRGWQVDSMERIHKADDLLVPSYLVDDASTRSDLALYYDEVSRFDRAIGQVVDYLKDEQVLDQTCLIVMADNGRPFPRCKTRMYDSGVKTPLVMSLPGRIMAGESEALVSSVDLASTILDLTEVPVRDHFQGRSFTSVLKDPGLTFRRYAFAEHNWHDYEAHERMVTDGKHMLIRNFRPDLPLGGPADSKRSPSQTSLVEAQQRDVLTEAQSDNFLQPRPLIELYDLLEDPNQLHNLSDDRRYSSVKSEMLRVLMSWMEDTGDDVPGRLTADHFDRQLGTRLGETSDISRGQIPGMEAGAELSLGQPGF